MKNCSSHICIIQKIYTLFKGFENVRDPIELDRILEEGIRRVRRLSISSQVSDSFRLQFPVQAEVHPIPDKFRSPGHIPQHITERIVSQHITLPTHQIQVSKSNFAYFTILIK